MAQGKVTADPLKRSCARALSQHRSRARQDHQRLDYSLRQLLELAGRAQVCPYCKQPLTPGILTFDHAVPTCRRADYGLANLRACCRPCNSAKGLMSADEYLALLALLKTFHPAVFGDVLGRLRAGGRRYRGV